MKQTLAHHYATDFLSPDLISISKANHRHFKQRTHELHALLPQTAHRRLGSAGVSSICQGRPTPPRGAVTALPGCFHTIPTKHSLHQNPQGLYPPGPPRQAKKVCFLLSLNRFPCCFQLSLRPRQKKQFFTNMTAFQMFEGLAGAVANPPANRPSPAGDVGLILVPGRSSEKKMSTHSSILVLCTEEPGGL